MTPFVGPDCESPRATLRAVSLLGNDLDTEVTGRVCLDLARIAWLSKRELRQNPILVSVADGDGNAWEWSVGGLGELVRGWV